MLNIGVLRDPHKFHVGQMLGCIFDDVIYFICIVKTINYEADCIETLAVDGGYSMYFNTDGKALWATTHHGFPVPVVNARVILREFPEEIGSDYEAALLHLVERFT